jgi:hypothetical protein
LGKNLPHLIVARIACQFAVKINCILLVSDSEIEDIFNRIEIFHLFLKLNAVKNPSNKVRRLAITAKLRFDEFSSTQLWK